MYAALNTAGTEPECRDLLYSSSRNGARTSAQAFSRRVWQLLDGPGDMLDGQRLEIDKRTARWSRRERRMWSVGNERTDVDHLCIELSATRHGSAPAQHSVDKSRDERSESTLLVHNASRFLQSKAVNTALSSAIGGGEIVSTGRTSRALQLADSAFR